MSKLTTLHDKWSREPDYREAYDRLGPEFELSRSLIEARTRARLTQAELAAAHEDDAVGDSPARERPQPSDPPGRWRKSRKQPAPNFASASTRA